MDKSDKLYDIRIRIRSMIDDCRNCERLDCPEWCQEFCEQELDGIMYDINRLSDKKVNVDWHDGDWGTCASCNADVYASDIYCTGCGGEVSNDPEHNLEYELGKKEYEEER